MWQLAQPDVMPVWFIVQVVKPPGMTVLVWQFSHGAVVEMWVVGLPTINADPTVELGEPL
jgi:hypothetical protein